MNDELIKRIDDWQYKLDGFDYFDSAEAERLIADCRAEIERLSKPVRYVPMTEKQRAQWWSSDWSNGVMLWKFERAVIRLAIAQGAKLEVQE